MSMHLDRGGGGSLNVGIRCIENESMMLWTSSRRGLLLPPIEPNLALLTCLLNPSGRALTTKTTAPPPKSMPVKTNAPMVTFVFAEESETNGEESDVSGSDGDDTSWISCFCNLRGNKFFCEVDDEYVQDYFNLCGLSTQVPYYDYALDLLLDVESSHGDIFTEEQNELIESAAEMLYGLIHVRYVLASREWLQCHKSTKTLTLEDVPDFIAPDSLAIQLDSRTSRVQAL